VTACVAMNIPSFIIHFGYTSVWILCDKLEYEPRTACKYLILKQAGIKEPGTKNCSSGIFIVEFCIRSEKFYGYKAMMYDRIHGSKCESITLYFFFSDIRKGSENIRMRV